MSTRRLAIACFVALIISGLVSSTAAEKGDKQIRFGVLYSMPTDDGVDGVEVTELDSALGFHGAFEFRVTDLIGIEPGINYASHDLTVKEPPFDDVTGSTDLLAVTVNVNFHFEQANGLDIFVGPTVGYALWDDIQLDPPFPAPQKTDDEFMFGANVGLDYPFGEGGWAFNAGLSYLIVDVATIGVSPVQLRVGLAYSF